jgi:hypothetical protein
MTIFMFVPHFYVFWNGASSSTRGEIWKLLVTQPLLGSDSAHVWIASMALTVKLLLAFASTVILWFQVQQELWPYFTIWLYVQCYSVFTSASHKHVHACQHDSYYYKLNVFPMATTAVASVAQFSSPPIVTGHWRESTALNVRRHQIS